jgi:hypothetical protein
VRCFVRRVEKKSDSADSQSGQNYQHCHCRKGQDIPEKALLEKQNLIAGIPGLGDEVLDCFLKEAEEIRAEPEVLPPRRPHTKISSKVESCPVGSQ